MFNGIILGAAGMDQWRFLREWWLKTQSDQPPVAEDDWIGKNPSDDTRWHTRYKERWEREGEDWTVSGVPHGWNDYNHRENVADFTYLGWALEDWLRAWHAGSAVSNGEFARG